MTPNAPLLWEKNIWSWTVEFKLLLEMLGRMGLSKIDNYVAVLCAKS